MTDIGLRLTKDEALVLFEWLTKHDEGERSQRDDKAESRVFDSLLVQLEKSLVEPLREDYRDLLKAARAKLGAE